MTATQPSARNDLPQQGQRLCASSPVAASVLTGLEPRYVYGGADDVQLERCDALHAEGCRDPIVRWSPASQRWASMRG